MGKAATQAEVLIPSGLHLYKVEIHTGYVCTKIYSELLPVNVWLMGFNFILVNQCFRKHILGKSLNALHCN